MALRRVSRVTRPRQQPPGEDIESRINSRNRRGTNEAERTGSTRRGSDAPRPLGVPDDYRALAPRGDFRGMSPRAVEGWTARGAGPGTLREIGPRYHDGDEWLPASQGVESIIHKQRALVIAGYLGADEEFTYGRWDENTREAYYELLSEANASGLTADQQLLQAAQGFRSGGGGGGEGGGGGGGPGYTIDPVTGEIIEEQYVAPPLELKLPNKEDVMATMRKAAISTLGQGLDADSISRMADAYLWEVTRLQKQAYDQAVAVERADWEGGRTTGGEVIQEIDAPSAETFAQGELYRRDPSGYTAGRVVNEAVPAFFQAIQSWGSR